MEKEGIPLIISETGKFRLYDYPSERDLEKRVVEHSKEIFGKSTIYLDVKKRVTSKGGISGIPDGFLIDLENSKFYIIEVELSAHDIVGHISNQIVRFKAAMGNADSRMQLAKELHKKLLDGKQETGEVYDIKHLERIMNQGFGIFIIIDNVSEQLSEIVNVLSQDGTEVIAVPFETYVDSKKNYIHKFTTFTKDALERESKKWTFKWTTIPVEEHLEKTSTYMKELFSELSAEILRMPGVKERSRKGWITYQTSPLKNFCTIRVMPNCLEVHLKSDKNFQDGRGISKSIGRTQAWAFDKVFTLNSKEDVGYALGLVKQAYECTCKH